MRKLVTIFLILLAFTTTVSSSKSEVSYEIYYSNPTLDLVDIIKHIEETYSTITANTDKDDVGVMVRLHIDEFKREGIENVQYEENSLKVYMCDTEEVVFTYKGYLQDYCKNNVEKKSWLNIWNL